MEYYDFYVIYRISDHGYNKVKPDYVNNEKCWWNFASNQVMSDIRIKTHVICDNYTGPLLKYFKGNDLLTYEETSLGSGAASFNHALDYALNLDDEDIVYFLEDDYLHRREWYKILLEGIEMGADYVSLYDHPDKYMNGTDGGNPYVQNGGEVTRVMISRSTHWKLTNSTTMTFAAKVKTLREDEEILRQFTSGTYPRDFDMFLKLREKGRALITPLPGYSTHGETAWLSPFMDWKKA